MWLGSRREIQLKSLISGEKKNENIVKSAEDHEQYKLAVIRDGGVRLI